MNKDTGREVASGRYSKSPGLEVAGGLIHNIVVQITRAKYPSRKLSRSLELGAARSRVGYWGIEAVSVAITPCEGGDGSEKGPKRGYHPNCGGR